MNEEGKQMQTGGVGEDAGSPVDILTWLNRLNPPKAGNQSGKCPVRVPSLDEYEALVEEVALEYFTHEELAVRFKTSLTVLDQIMRDPHFSQAVAIARRKLDEDDTASRLIARREVRKTITEMTKVVELAESQQARAKAFEQLRQVANLGTVAANPQGGGSSAVQLVINTNLDMNDKPMESGRYTIEAKPVEDDNFGDLL